MEIIIKSVDGSFEDELIKWEKSWNVEQLKEYISTRVAKKPLPQHQKLIYQGKLIHNQDLLLNILGKFPKESKETIYLICNESDSQTSTISNFQLTQRGVQSSSILKNTVTTSQHGNINLTKSDETDELTRASLKLSNNVSSSFIKPTVDNSLHILSQSYPQNTYAGMTNNNFIASSPSLNSTNVSNSYDINQLYPNINSTRGHNPYIGISGHGSIYGVNIGGIHPSYSMPNFIHHNMINYGPIPHYGGRYNAHQYMWMHQAYIQYIAQFYRILQSAPQNFQPPNNFDSNNGIDEEVIAEGNRIQVGAVGGRGVRMNVQGGADEDDEIADRDWLDWFYVFVRFTLLLSICYYYSTPTRFLFITCVAIVLYLHQGGWLRVYENLRNNRNNVADHLNNHAININNRVDNGNNIPEQDNDNPVVHEVMDNDAEDIVNANVYLPQLRESLHIVATMLVSFFTSLAPQAPPPININ